MTFKRTKEDFTCEHCGALILGNGYTNHCSQCLWSKHVDKDPGDREELCKGMMEPWEVESKSGGFRIVHRCVACGFTRPSPFLMEDNIEAFGKALREAAKRREDLLR